MTDNQVLTIFLEAKYIHQSFWNICDQILQFIFVLVQISGVETPAIN